jgi:hypothetical protein
MSDGFDLNAFQADLDETLRQGRVAFQGKYRQQLDELAGLSRAEIDAITPGITDLQKYDELITVVKEASRVNLAQAQLKQQIEKLGNVAVSIAKHVPSLAQMFV